MIGSPKTRVDQVALPKSDPGSVTLDPRRGSVEVRMKIRGARSYQRDHSKIHRPESFRFGISSAADHVVSARESESRNGHSGEYECRQVVCKQVRPRPRTRASMRAVVRIYTNTAATSIVLSRPSLVVRTTLNLPDQIFSSGRPTHDDGSL